MVVDEHGITKIYPSYADHPQYFSFPSSISTQQPNNDIWKKLAIQGTLGASSVTVGNTLSVLWWEFTPKDDENDTSKIFVLPSSLTADDKGKIDYEVNCDLNQEETANQGHINVENGEWRDVEMTSHFFVRSVKSKDGYIFFEARNGYDGKEGGCCQGTAYGVRLYWDATGDNKGKIAFYKREFSGSTVLLPKQTQTPIVKLFNFYQKWFGAKFVIYNTERDSLPTSSNPVVKMELYLTPVTFAQPSLPISNSWTKVAEIEDRVGKGWNYGGKECNAPTEDYPISWSAPLIAFGWKYGKVIQFNYTSFREIDVTGNFGEDPEPYPNPNPDPTLPPPPDPNPPQLPEPAPPDAEPPLTSTTLVKRLTLRREIVNNATCSCDGLQQPEPEVPPDGGGGGGGGGGSGTLVTLFNVALTNDASFVRLAKVEDSSAYYLRMGQGVTQENSNWINKIIARIEITIAKFQDPRNSTDGGVKCVIRKGSDDSVAVTFDSVATESEIIAAGKVCIFQNLTHTYKMQYEDKLLFEYDGGSRDDYIIIFTRRDQPLTGTKIIWQANDQDAGEYRDLPDTDICARIYIKPA